MAEPLALDLHARPLPTSCRMTAGIVPTPFDRCHRTPSREQTKGLAAELGPQGVRVNCVAPGIVPTKFSAALVQTPELVRGGLG